MRLTAILGVVGKVVGGLLLGLVLAEAIFWWRDDGAFSHVNFYQPDLERGVRLQPNAKERLLFSGNPRTTIHTNNQGYRGEDASEPTANDIVVVGDSQVFGLGVEDHQTFSAALSAKTGRPVINAGVPTYGPQEYLAVARDFITTRKPAAVVFVVNMANDLFEVGRPNHMRHQVWDGWAVRSETAPANVTWFPGRTFLMSQSHAIYALRKWLHHSADADVSQVGFDSEGSWQDLVKRAEARRADTQTEELASRSGHKQSEALNLAAKSLASHERHLGEYFARQADSSTDERLVLAAGANVGDIVGGQLTEASRPVLLTAQQLQAGAQVLAGYEASLLVTSDAIRTSVQKRFVLEKLLKQYAAGRDALAARDEARETLHRLRTEPRPPPKPSGLLPELGELAELGKQHGVRMVVLVLPLDVQTHPREWQKYNVKPLDMSSTLALNQTVYRDAKLLGLDAVDATAALQKTEGAFLNADIHLSVHGHQAVAQVLADAIKANASLAQPSGVLPQGRTWLPTTEEWQLYPEIEVKGSTRAACETVAVDEWLRVACRRATGLVPTGISIQNGGHGDVGVLVTADGATLVAPVLAGETLNAMVQWQSHVQLLTVSRDDKGLWQGELGVRTTPGVAFENAAADSKLCACYRGQKRDLHCASADRSTCTNTCENIHGSASAACFATYADDCDLLVRCAQGDPGAPPRCPANQAIAGGLAQCRVLCSAQKPCDNGTCTAWPGTEICQ